MKLLNIFLIAFVICFTRPLVAQEILIDNVTLNPNQTVTRSYSFAPFSTMFCYSNGSANKGKIPPFQGTITFPFHGQPITTLMPIELTTNPDIFSGQPIDPNGTIVVFNEQPVQLIVSCIFAY